MLRFQTVKAEDVSAEFSPVGDLLLQAKVPAESVTLITILGKVHKDAEFVVLNVWKPHEAPIHGIGKLPFLKLRVTGNQDGQMVTIWDNQDAPAKAEPKPEPINDKIPARVKPINDHVRDYAEVVDNTKGNKIPEMRRTFVEPIEEAPVDNLYADSAGLPAEI